MAYFINDTLHEETTGIPIRDRGFLLGDGIFETISIKNNNPIFLREHFSRLIDAAQLLDISFDKTIEWLEEKIEKLIEMNFSREIANGSARLTLTRGDSSRGIAIPNPSNPRIILTVVEDKSSHNSLPLSLKICSIRRNEYSPLSFIKSLCYLDNILGRKEALEQNADDAIFLNTKGHVACISIGNIFIVKENGDIVTPPVDAGILPGITRNHVINLCNENGIKIYEKTFYKEELFNAKEIFITNSIIGIKKAFVNNYLANQKFPITELIEELYDHSLKRLVEVPQEPFHAIRL